MRFSLIFRATVPAIVLALALALPPTRTDAIETDPIWGIICSTWQPHDLTRVAFSNATTGTTAPCGARPTTFQQPPSVGGNGDTSVALDVGYNPVDAQLCFVNNTLTQAPVIRVGAGHLLTINLTNTLQNTGPHNTLNCGIQTFGGEGVCLPRPIYQEAPGADGSFYPIEANQQHTANGTTNLHVHGLFVSPQPCSDEVIQSALYPTNWGLPVVLQSCQSALNQLTYTYDLPADHPSGMYWYHTHRHGMSEQQTQMGLVGAIIVEDDGDLRRAKIGVTDEVLVVSDTPIKTCVDGPTCDIARTQQSSRADTLARKAAARQMARDAARAHPAATSQGSPSTLDPRIDQVDQAGSCAAGAVDANGGYQLWSLLLNGVLLLDSPGENWPPDSEVMNLTLQPGQRKIFRMVNASADSFIAPRLSLSQNGTTTIQNLEVFARDGVGIVDASGHRVFGNYDVARDQFILPPAGRVEFVVHAPPPGATIYLDTTQVAPGCGGNQYPPRRMLRITTAGTPVDPGAADDSDLLTGGPRLDSYLSTLKAQPTVSRTFVLSEYGRDFTYAQTKWLTGPPKTGQFDPGQVDFYLTQVAASDGEADPSKTALIPFLPHNVGPQVVVHLKGQSSVTEDWLVQNSTLELHTFHMHQIHFRDITQSSTDITKQAVLDTINVPPAQLVGDIPTGYPGTPGWVKLRMTFTTADIGEFVFHCHILEHEDNGMMAKVIVVPD
jgi:FtsP/CotA-like multicopper oxidase with cupredoxin domain